MITCKKQNFLLIFLLFFCNTLFARDDDSPWQHALTLFDAPKYPADFYAFDYVNTNAPKGGHLRLAIHGTFDSLNAYNGKGVAPSSLSSIAKYGFSELNETLMVSSASANGPMDEQYAAYGLIAESVKFSKKNQQLAFKLNPKATFNDNHPITSRDVIFSFNTLTALPYGRFSGMDQHIERIETPAANQVVFKLKPPYPLMLPLHLAELPVLPEHFWQNHDFHKTSLLAPLSSGPYQINRIIPGKLIEMERVRDYWGKDLPVNRGKHNFDKISLHFYRDLHIAFESFKSGNTDAWFEVQSKNWATGYHGEAINNGLIIRREIPHTMSYGARAYVFNIRKPYLQDRRVREAISLMFDWNWISRAIFHNAYTRTQSYFPHIPLTSPSNGEAQLLQPFSATLPPALFTQPFTFPTTTGDGNIKEHQKQALSLLRQAGWELQQDKLVNTLTKQPMKLVFIHENDSQFERIVFPLIQNLKKIGIAVTLQRMDLAQYYQRLKHHEFDMVQYIYPLPQFPGEELLDFFHSASVKHQDGRSLMGLEDPAVDALIDQIIAATGKHQLETATSALNRVLLWQHYGILNWHGNSHRIAWWHHLKHPESFPPYGFSLNTWWAEQNNRESQ
ncbi:extracellular solute-binding protein [Endozoicomonas sp. ONNA2]|uniref:extracellular solute-binding protein n=1 Tax=Endozoicomonas sp. ONNA2 TaxID=2828741 RepID=UPI0021482F8A|nr:extracellular solute-binding protein [Endozoicomonas sp. ONNA2]